MGSGAFGSNGSLHWSIDHEDGGPPRVGTDVTKKHPENGNSSDPRPPLGSPGHTATIRVTARYRNHGQARAALQSALNNLQPGSSVVTLDVNLREFQKAPGQTDGWEVSVDW